MRPAVLTPQIWNRLPEPARSYFTDGLRRFAWTHPGECYRMVLRGHWWTICRYRQDETGRVLMGRAYRLYRRLPKSWRRCLRRWMPGPARRLPLIVRVPR